MDRNAASYKAGQTARRQWNRWLGGQHGERRKGAIYWLNAVAGQHARQCDGTVEFALGCFDAHRHMDRIEPQFAISRHSAPGGTTPRTCAGRGEKPRNDGINWRAPIGEHAPAGLGLTVRPLQTGRDPAQSSSVHLHSAQWTPQGPMEPDHSVHAAVRPVACKRLLSVPWSVDAK